MSSQLKKIEATLKRLNQKYQNNNDQKTKLTFGSQKVEKVNDHCHTKDINLETELSPTVKNQTALSLPNFQIKNQSNSSHLYISNSALPMNLLADLQKKVIQWQNSLIDIHQKIQAIYQEGPLLDCWLESHQNISFSVSNQTRKANQDHLMGYIEELTENNISYQSPRFGYHLCGRDKTGKIWSQSCPADQVGEVTIAIARYQKLQQLLAEKKKIETRLTQLAESLVILHSSICDH